MRKEVNGLDMIEVLSKIQNEKNRKLAIMLNEIEAEMDPSSDEFELVRKSILDHFNDFTRYVFAVLLGDNIEGLKFH